MLAEQGFNVTVIDIPTRSKEESKTEKDSVGPDVELVRIDSIEELVDIKGAGEFDFGMAYNSLYYGTRQELSLNLKGLLEILKQDGFFYITLISTRNADYGKGKRIEAKTFKLGEMTRHFADAEDIVSLMGFLEIIDLRNEEQDTRGSMHWHILARNRLLLPPSED